MFKRLLIMKTGVKRGSADEAVNPYQVYSMTIDKFQDPSHLSFYSYIFVNHLPKKGKYLNHYMNIKDLFLIQTFDAKLSYPY